MNVLVLRTDGALETFHGSEFGGFDEQKLYDEVRLDHDFADYAHNGVLKGVAIMGIAMVTWCLQPTITLGLRMMPRRQLSRASLASRLEKSAASFRTTTTTTTTTDCIRS